MKKTRNESEEVLYATQNTISIDKQDLEELKKLAVLNNRKRIRLCAHMHPDEKMHDMIIVHMRDCYVRPHKHLNRSESITILEGESDLILFDEDGLIVNVINMGEPYTGKKFFYRISSPIYHMLIIRSRYLVFHEATEGPFDSKDTEFPEWSPSEDSQELMKFMASIDDSINNKS